jgi:hypothetical protein
VVRGFKHDAKPTLLEKMNFFQPAEDAECVLPSRGQVTTAQAGGKRNKRKTYRAANGKRRLAKTRKYRR